MDYNAFDAGIEPGGLRNSNEIMVLICYLLKKVEKPLSKKIINEVMQSEGLANYFEVSQALVLLTMNDCLVVEGKENDEFYHLTKNGEDAMLTLRSILPKSVREKAVESTMRLLKRKKHEKENKVSIKKDGDKVFITCTVLDHDMELCSVTLLVANVSQAEEIKQRFFDNPTRLYQNVLSALTEDLES